jgi:transposase
MRLIDGSLRIGEGSSVDVMGIDISKADFHVCLLQGGRVMPKSFPNDRTGYRQLQQWLRDREVAQVHACMEATGGYWLGLATTLFESGMRVSVVNPSKTTFFARSQLRRTKTDKVDAEMIAEFCKTQQPGSWQPPAPEILELRALLSYRHQLVDQRVTLEQTARDIHAGKELSKLHSTLLKSLAKTLAGVECQMRELVKAHENLKAAVARLEAVAGIGFLTAVSIVAKLPVERLRNGKAAAAYVGLSPSERQSGTSVHGKPRICKTGDAELRRDLYMPAVVAMRYNPILAEFAARLKERGKPSKVVIVAVMRKLVVLAYELLKAPEAENLGATA